MKGHSILDFDTYSRAERTGRVLSPGNYRDRRVIFDVFERYQRASSGKDGWITTTRTS